jgi:hypothetical protein
MQNLISTAAIGFLSVFVVTSSGCSMFERPPKPQSNWTIQEAKRFDEFDLYWLAQEYRGLPLTYVGRSIDADEVEHVTFAYGDPSYFGDAASGSWLSPLEIDIQPYCGFLRHEVLSDEEFDDLGIEPESSGDVRIGDAVGRVSRYDYWSLLSGTSYIDISTNRHADFDIEQAAGDLFPIAKDSGEELKPLPSPTSTEC